MTPHQSEESAARSFAYAQAFLIIVTAIGWSRSGESGWFMPKPEGWN